MGGGSQAQDHSGRAKVRTQPVLQVGLLPTGYQAQGLSVPWLLKRKPTYPQRRAQTQCPPTWLLAGLTCSSCR